MFQPFSACIVAVLSPLKGIVRPLRCLIWRPVNAQHGRIHAYPAWMDLGQRLGVVPLSPEPHLDGENGMAH